MYKHIPYSTKVVDFGKEERQMYIFGILVMSELQIMVILAPQLFICLVYVAVHH